MRAPLGTLAGLAGIALTGSLLTGCGNDGGATAADPGTPASPAASGTPSQPASASPSGKPVSVRKTCAELYHPPTQLMPRAIEFVHGSPSAEDASAAEEIATGLDEVASHSLGPLAEDIAVARAGVEAKREASGSGSEGADLKEFDAAANRLARHCELYND